LKLRDPTLANDRLLLEFLPPFYTCPDETPAIC
jgi:hypothetical protein